jgi:hypothetical protein
MSLVPVDHDPFASPVATGNLIPVDHDPFATSTAPAPTGNLTPVDHDPFAAPPAGNLTPVDFDPFAAPKSDWMNAPAGVIQGPQGGLPPTEGAMGPIPVTGTDQNAPPADAGQIPIRETAPAAPARRELTLRGPYTEEEKRQQGMQEPGLEAQAASYARSTAPIEQYFSKPILALVGNTVAGKISRDVANRMELGLHPERYYSLITGDRKAPTAVEIKDAALRSGALDIQNPIVKTLVQDIPGFAMGGDALVASAPYIGLPLLNLTHQILDNDLAAQKGERPHWDIETLKESAAMGAALHLIPLPKALTEQEGGALKRFARETGAAAWQTLTMTAAEAAAGRQPSQQDVLNNFVMMAGMRLPEMIQQVYIGRMVTSLRKAGINAREANAYVNDAFGGDLHAQAVVERLAGDPEYAQAFKRANELRDQIYADQTAEATRQRDLIDRAKAGDQAAKDELRRARNLPVTGGEGQSPEARRQMPEGETLLPMPTKGIPGEVGPLGGRQTAEVNIPSAAVLRPAPAIARAREAVDFVVKSPVDRTRRAMGYWAIADLGQLKTAGAVEAGLQTRDRDRVASENQAVRIYKQFDAEELGPSTTSVDGAPIIDDQGRILAGYVRRNVLAKVYSKTDDRQDQYRAYVAQMAKQLGIADQIAGKARPVLVRVTQDYANTTPQEFADQSNARKTLGFSASEQAMRDAKMITDNDMLSVLQPDESGNLRAASNRDFMRRFLDLVGPNEAAELVNADGSPSAALDRRMKTAVLTSLMQEHPQAPKIVNEVVENAADYGIVSLVNGLTQAAPALAQMKARVPEFDLSPLISRAMPVILAARRYAQEHPGQVGALETYLNQEHLWSDMNIPKGTKELTRLFIGLKSATAVSKLLTDYTQEAARLGASQGTRDMFAGQLPESQRIDILRRLLKGTHETQGTEGPVKVGAANTEGIAPGGGGQPGGGPSGILAGGETDAGTQAREATPPYNVEQELFGRGSYNGKSALRQKLEWLAESKTGQARADKRILIQRDVQNKAKALLDALDAKRIDEAEAGRRLQISEDQAIKALEKVEREGQRRAAAAGGEQQDFLVDKSAIKDMLFSSQLEFNYDYPQRPGEDKATNVEQALRAIEEIQGRNNLRLRTQQLHPGQTDSSGFGPTRALREELLRSQQNDSPGYEPASILRRGGKVILNIIGRGLTYNLSKTAHTPLVGQRLDTAAGIQELVKTARNARLETWRILIIKDGTVVFDLPYASRLPGCVIIPKIPSEMTDVVRRLTAEFNADAIDFHNHPSGNTRMSGEDLLVHTRLHQEIGPHYKGSMTGNHGEYTFKTPLAGYPTTVESKRIQTQPDLLTIPDISHPALGQPIDAMRDIWKIAQKYNHAGDENKIMLIGCTTAKNGSGKVQGVAELDQVMLDAPARAQALIRLFARNTGAIDVFVAGISREAFAKYQPLLEEAVRRGVVRDVTLNDGTSLVNDLHIQRTDPLKGATFGMPAHSVRLAEPGADYGDKDKSKMRGFAERAAGAKGMPAAEATAIRANPENQYKPQSYAEINQRLAAMSDTELADARDGVKAGLPTDGNENISVLAGLELLNRRLARGEDVQNEVTKLAQAGTTIAQLLRQYAELKTKTPWGLLAVIERQLAGFNRQLRPGQRERLTHLIQEDFATRDLLRAAERMAMNDFTDANVAAVDDLRAKADRANRDVMSMVRDVMPQKIANMLITALQGNLLTPMSQVANITGNLLFVPLQDAAQAMAAAMDGLHSLITRRARKVLSPTVGTLAGIHGAGRGIAQASRQLVHGVPSGEISGETIRGFRPIRAAVQAVTGDMAVGPNGRVAALDRFKKGLEAIIGAAPEPMLRFLSFGDMPFSEARRAKALVEQGRLRGLAGTELEKFIRFPDAESMTLVERQARTIVFQQENRLASWLYKGLNDIPKDGLFGPTIEVTLRTFAPYLKTPINLTWQALQFHPVVALAEVLRHAKRGDRRSAYMSMGYFVLGSMMAYAANYLLKHNLMSGDVSRDPKIRDLQYAIRPPNRVNLSALRRHLAGEENDPAWREEDILFSYTKLGFTGIVFNIWANHKDAMDRYALKHGPIQSKVVSMLLSQGFLISETGAAMLNMASLKGTANLLDSIANKTYNQFLPAWFQAVTAIPIPNSYSAFDRTKQVYLPDLKGDGTLTNNSFVNAVRAKLGMTDNLPLRRDLLGRPIPRTPYGAISWLYQLFDVTKVQKIANDPIMREIYMVYTATGDAAAIPSIPDDKIMLPGNPVTRKGPIAKDLNRKEYERYSELVGQARLDIVQKRLFPSNQYQRATPEHKLKMLNNAWQSGADEGKNKFIKELLNRPVPGAL